MDESVFLDKFVLKDLVEIPSEFLTECAVSRRYIRCRGSSALGQEMAGLGPTPAIWGFGGRRSRRTHGRGSIQPLATSSVAASELRFAQPLLVASLFLLLLGMGDV